MLILFYKRIASFKSPFLIRISNSLTVPHCHQDATTYFLFNIIILNSVSHSHLFIFNINFYNRSDADLIRIHTSRMLCYISDIPYADNGAQIFVI